MKKQEREFLLRLVNGNTSIFNTNFLKGDEAEGAVKELERLMQQVKESLQAPENGIFSDLESAINAAESEACIQAYLEGMRMGAKIIHILLEQEA